MGLFKMKTALLGLTAAVAMNVSLHAEFTIDGDFDDNQNNMEYYWYYYDDAAGIGSNDRLARAKTSTPSVIDVKSGDTTNANGDKCKSYTFTTGDDGDGGKCSIMPFTYGDNWPTSWDEKMTQDKQFVGTGCMLTADGKSVDLSEATGIKFRIRSAKNALSIRFKVQTAEIDEISCVKDSSLLDGDEFGYYGTAVDVTTSWAEQTVAFDDLALPGTWAKKIDFNQKACTKLAWEIEKKANPDVTDDTLYIDDIVILGDYEYVSPWFWTKTASAAPSDGYFATFDKAPYNQTPQMMYWYAYNDGQIGGTSSVSEEYAILDPDTKLLTLQWVKTTGSDGKGQGCAVDYKIGPAVDKKGTKVNGFIGVGCNTYDSAAATYWDAKGEGVTDIYFEYMLAGDLDRLTLEVSDNNDVADKDNPTREDSKRGAGVVRSRCFKNTDGEWVKVQIPLDSLIQHTDWEGSKDIALDQTKLAKLQWKVQGGEGKTGQFAIDNIAFPGWTKSDIAVKMAKNAVKAANFNVAFHNGNINVSWANEKALSSGKVSIINARGVVVASRNIAKTTDLSASFSSKRLPAGMYFVALSGVNASGKAVSMQSSLSLVK